MRTFWTTFWLPLFQSLVPISCYSSRMLATLLHRSFNSYLVLFKHALLPSSLPPFLYTFFSSSLAPSCILSCLVLCYSDLVLPCIVHCYFSFTLPCLLPCYNSSVLSFLVFATFLAHFLATIPPYFHAWFLPTFFPSSLQLFFFLIIIIMIFCSIYIS